MKRTFSGDEIYTNGDGLMNANVSMTDLTKKSRSEPSLPSRVVHLRNIDSNEVEIAQLGVPFGRISNILNLRKKSQAFIEFDTTESAKHMVDYFSAAPAMHNGRQIFVQFSNHGELRTDPTNRSNQQAHVALAQATDLYETAQKGGPNCVLRASVINMLFPVTIDVLYQIFSKFGTVLKIITFTKNDRFQALIQLKDPNAASQAKTQLHGQNIYNGCCTLQIEYSKLHSLIVKYNNDKSRDFTNPTLPAGEASLVSHHDADHMHSNVNLVPLGRSGASDDYRYDYYSGVARGRPPSNSAASAYDMQNNGSHLMGPMQTASGAYNPMVGAPGTPQYPHPYSSGHPTQTMHPMTSNHPGAAAAHMHAVHHSGQHPQNLSMHQSGQMMTGSNSPVLLVSNLNEDMTTPESLFTLFGVYGDVHRVKILFNKKDSALIQFAAPQQAAIAHQNLDHVTIFGKQIKLSFSKHQFVQMPKDGASDMGLTKDFTNSPLHRFKKPGSKNYNNIFPPSSVLHLSNIPNEISEDDIRRIFSQFGTIKRFKFFEKDRKMALIEMNNSEEAITALINTHNYQLADSMHLRVSFSKSKV